MKIAGELWAGRELVTLFRAEGSVLEVVSVIFATYRRKNAGAVTISLYRVVDEAAVQPAVVPLPVSPWKRRFARIRAKLHVAQPALKRDEPLAPNIPVELGERLADLTVSCAALLDNQPLDFFTGPVPTLPGELLALRVRTNAPAGASPTVWLTDGGEQLAGHVRTYAGDEMHEMEGLRARDLWRTGGNGAGAENAALQPGFTV